MHSQRSKNSKKDPKMTSKLLKEGSGIRRSFDGRKSMNLTREDHFKISCDDFTKSRYRENVINFDFKVQIKLIEIEDASQKGNKNNKSKDKNSNMPFKKEEKLDYKARLKRAQSSRPLRMALKDLE